MFAHTCVCVYERKHICVYDCMRVGVCACQVESLCQSFTAPEEQFGLVREVPLIPGGEAVEVTARNKRAFVQARFKYAMMDCIAASLGPFLTGFYEATPQKKIKQTNTQQPANRRGRGGRGKGGEQAAGVQDRIFLNSSVLQVSWAQRCA